MIARITVLCDNHAAPGLEAEHGFALWIEYNNTRVLFDTGNGSAIWHNAAQLGIDLSSANHIILSHGHYDHSGNLTELLVMAPAALLHLHPAAVQKRYSIRESAKFIGMPKQAVFALQQLDETRLYHCTQPSEIIPGLWLTGEVPRQTAFEDCGGPFFLDESGNQPDLIIDDLSLWFKTSDGIVICTGCCHAGVINTLNHINSLTDHPPVQALTGGLHLGSASMERLKKTAEILRQSQIRQITPAHCTGEQATKFLQQSVGNSVTSSYAGLILEFERHKL